METARKRHRTGHQGLTRRHERFTYQSREVHGRDTTRARKRRFNCFFFRPESLQESDKKINFLFISFGPFTACTCRVFPDPVSLTDDRKTGRFAENTSSFSDGSRERQALRTRKIKPSRFQGTVAQPFADDFNRVPGRKLGDGKRVTEGTRAQAFIADSGA